MKARVLMGFEVIVAAGDRLGTTNGGEAFSLFRMLEEGIISGQKFYFMNLYELTGKSMELQPRFLGG